MCGVFEFGAHLKRFGLNAGTDEADAQFELKHAIAQGNSEAQRAANEKLVCVQSCPKLHL